MVRGVPLTILHVITGLNVGGAEAMLSKLVTHSAVAAAGQRHEVLTLMPPGVAGRRLAALSAPPHSLGIRRPRAGLGAAMRLAKVVRQVRPDIVQGWMHHGNLAAMIGQQLVSPRPTLMWNVRHSLEDIALENPMTRAILRFEARRSRSPATIIYNSRVAARQHGDIGFDGSRSCIIPNGFDCGHFAPVAVRRGALASRFGIEHDATVVAMIARRHPMKSPETLVEAVGRARSAGIDLHLLMVGDGMDTLPSEMHDAFRRAVPEDRLTFAPHRSDLAEWLPEVDILALPSAWGEGFPNILGEAMACGVPCVTTDVGDSGWVVGETGEVVPPRDASALEAALIRLERLGPEGRRRLGRAARQRVVDEFSLGETVSRYTDLYADAAETRAGRIGGTA